MATHQLAQPVKSRRGCRLHRFAIEVTLQILPRLLAVSYRRLASVPDWDNDWGTDEQQNHLQLFAFVSGLLARSTPIELYGVWNNDYHFPPARHESIQADQLQRPEFFFRERCKYLVTV